MSEVHLDSTDTAVIDREYAFRPIATAPRGAKLQLLGKGGVAVYSVYNGDPFWVGWAPVPCIPKQLKEAVCLV